MLKDFTIYKLLKKANEAFFCQHAMHVGFLKDCPQAIPLLAQ
jgi:hypothetical protein